jgi:hypothetical protein
VRNRYKPYIRRGNFGERTESWATAMRLAFYKVTRKPYYVMVQRGWPNCALDAQDSRRALKSCILMVTLGKMKFSAWTKAIMRQCQGAKTHAAVRIYHYFKGADNISLCKRATRNSTHETSEDAPEAYKCAKCGERHHNRPAPKPAERRVANG